VIGIGAYLVCCGAISMVCVLFVATVYDAYWRDL
jgi:hypothetical protein